MSKKLYIFSGIFLLIISCSKDELQNVVTLDATTITTKESEPNSTEKEKTATTSFDKTKNWVSKIQKTNGLLESSENTDFVSLYDNAISAILFTKQGEYDKTEQILDFFEGKMQSELNARSGGFYQFRDSNGENGSRTWMGDNAWLLIAINHYHDAKGMQKYDLLAENLENWLRQLQDNDGGLWGGRREDGTQIPKISEGIITAFNAVPGYDDFHINILKFLNNNRWSAANNTIVAWPENPAYNYALDLHALSYGAFESFPEKTLTQTERYYNTQIATVTGKEVSGYCFDEDKDVIWLEGTAQMAVAYQQAGNITKAKKLVLEIEKSSISSSSIEQSIGIPYTTNFGTNFGKEDLWNHADLAPALSASIWYLFAKMDFSPLTLGKHKNIPEEDKFWITEFD